MRMEKVSEDLQREEIHMEGTHGEYAASEGKQNKGRQKNRNGFGGRLLSGLGTLLCFMLASGLLINLLFDCMMTNTVGMVYWNNPYRMQQSVTLEETWEYGQMLYHDVAGLSHYLAVCTQLESEGEFDENKTIDIISYAYRKQGEIPDELKEIKLEYRVGDLIEWSNNGISFHEASPSEIRRIAGRSEDVSPQEGYNAGEVTEQYVESQESMEKTIEEELLLPDDEGEGMAEKVETDGSLPETMVEEAEQNNSSFESVVLTEDFFPVGKKSLYDIVLPEQVTYYEIAHLVERAANDLADNYAFYRENQGKFGLKRNLKYVLSGGDGRVLAANLENPRSVEIQKKEFRKNSSYVIYDYENDTIESKNIGTLTDFDIKSTFREYAYLYPQGAMVCVTVCSGSENTAYWGEYNTLDGYARTRRTFQNVSEEGMMQTVAILVFFVLAGFLLIVFAVLQPHKKPEELCGFDRLFTEIAALLAMGVEMGLLTLGVALPSELFYDNSYAQEGFLHKEEFFMMLMLIAFVMYVLFLFFWGSFIRRCKAHTLWSGSLVCTIFSKTKDFFGRICGGILNSKNFILRVAVPYAGFVLFCIFLVLAGKGIGAFLAILLNGVMIFFFYYQNQCRNSILEGITRICEGDIAYQIPTEKLVGDNKILAQHINMIGNTIERAVKTSLKDEKLKADLITNVSHDIKTPLTSIINYVDLLKKEEIKGERAQEYIRVLDEKSQRLKQLILDLVEASKISSGNIEIEKVKLDMTELMQQAIGEYEEKLAVKKLTVVTNFKGEKEDRIILADSRHMWRVFDNLFGNISKYAMEGTRVYLDMEPDEKKEKLILQIKNISEKPLQVPVEDLTRRFVRGDEARNTEGSGLGLSIAQTLVQTLGGSFQISLDGDLFKVTICFPKYKE